MLYKESTRNSVRAGWWIAVSCLALAGCGSSETASSGDEGGAAPVSTAKVDRAAAQAIRPEPGLYSRTVEFKEFDMPGLPAETARHMKDMMARNQDESFCLTRDEAEKGFRDMFDNVGQASKCRYDTFTVSDGKIDARMTCSHPSQGTAVMTLTGTGSPTDSDVTMTMQVTGATPPMDRMNMTMHVVSHRTGDCPS
ncbi:DUF3617 domain-containing protein [Novosphingobium profundi]|uniref:DUF3617 domain-containing protein n=1 Tax=Novosphingobium profundi TaxID=1774954 RepID=UPI001BDB29B1|nr:DUF3617 domain-containing protein [Novosphingobium profundi]MBT0670376.1 DUF3617 domain-containing protein [Novosphingobium profundi]